MLGNLAYAYFKADQPAKAQPLLDELEAQHDPRFRAILEQVGLVE